MSETPTPAEKPKVRHLTVLSRKFIEGDPNWCDPNLPLAQVACENRMMRHDELVVGVADVRAAQKQDGAIELKDMPTCESCLVVWDEALAKRPTIEQIKAAEEKLIAEQAAASKAKKEAQK